MPGGGKPVSRGSVGRAGAESVRYHRGMAGGSDAARALREALHRRSIEAVCRAVEPLDAACVGVLYDLPDARPNGALRDRLVYTNWMMVGYVPLGSSAITPFTLDGQAYVSVYAFHAALKLAEDDPRRAEVMAGRWRRRVGSRRGPIFNYRGEDIDANSAAHGLLMARATEAKVLAHASVREALAATGRRWLHISCQGRAWSYMPLALMAMRWWLAHR